MIKMPVYAMEIKYRLLTVFLPDCRCDDGQRAIFSKDSRSKLLVLQFESSQIRISHTCSTSLTLQEQGRKRSLSLTSPLFLLVLFLLPPLPPSPPLWMETNFRKLYWMGEVWVEVQKTTKSASFQTMGGTSHLGSWRTAASHCLHPSLLWTSSLLLPWSLWLPTVLSLPEVIKNPQVLFQDLKCPLPFTGSGSHVPEQWICIP